MPTKIEAYYNHAWAGQYDDPLQAPRHEALWQALDEVDRPPGAFLDAGCGQGELIGEALGRGFGEVIGADLSEAAVRVARERHPDAALRVHSVEDRPWPLPASSCSVVAAFEVIEHLYFPRELVMGARDVLASGGVLAVSTPYHGRVKSASLALRGFDHHFHPEGQHIRFFTDRALHDLLDDCGFDVLDVQHLGRARFVWKNVLMIARLTDRDVEDHGALLRDAPPRSRRA